MRFGTYNIFRKYIIYDSELRETYKIYFKIDSKMSTFSEIRDNIKKAARSGKWLLFQGNRCIVCGSEEEIVFRLAVSGDSSVSTTRYGEVSISWAKSLSGQIGVGHLPGGDWLIMYHGCPVKLGFASQEDAISWARKTFDVTEVGDLNRYGLTHLRIGKR